MAQLDKANDQALEPIAMPPLRRGTASAWLRRYSPQARVVCAYERRSGMTGFRSDSELESGALGVPAWHGEVPARLRRGVGHTAVPL